MKIPFLYSLMKHRQSAGIILLFLAGFFLIAISGCTSLPFTDTQNTTVALQDYNAWAIRQKNFDQQVRATTLRIGNHINDYNAAIVSDAPDLPGLRSSLAADRQLLDQWEDRISALNTAAARLESNSTRLTYSPAARELVSNLSQNMKVYAIDMENARQHLIDYTNFAGTYLGPDDPAYWNDGYRTSATNAREQAAQSLADADTALSVINDLAGRLQRMQ